jgi:hypothetical protein
VFKSWPLGRRTRARREGPAATSPAGACRVMPGLRVRRDTTGIVIVDHHDQSAFADDQKHRDVGFLRRRLSLSENAFQLRVNHAVGPTKGRQARWVPAPTFVLDELSEQCNGRVPADLVFPGPDGGYLPRPKSQRGWFAGTVKRARVRSTPPPGWRPPRVCASHDRWPASSDSPLCYPCEHFAPITPPDHFVGGHSTRRPPLRRCSSDRLRRSIPASPQFLEQPCAGQQHAADHQHPDGERHRDPHADIAGH